MAIPTPLGSLAHISYLTEAPYELSAINDQDYPKSRAIAPLQSLKIEFTKASSNPEFLLN